MTTNTSFVSTFTNLVTIITGVAFLSVATIGIMSPVHAQSTINIVSVR